MKFYENKFEEYLESHKKNSLHPYLEKSFSNLNIADNLIIYGAPGIGKYTQALRYIEKYSPSKLKYERKMPEKEVIKMKSFVSSKGEKLVKTSKFKIKKITEKEKERVYEINL